MPSCWSTELEFAEAAGRGTVYSHTTVQRAPSPAFEPPYVIALVRLAEGPVLLTAITGPAVECDDRVIVDWRPLPDGRHLPVFRKE